MTNRFLDLIDQLKRFSNFSLPQKGVGHRKIATYLTQIKKLKQVIKNFGRKSKVVKVSWVKWEGEDVGYRGYEMYFAGIEVYEAIEYVKHFYKPFDNQIWGVEIPDGPIKMVEQKGLNPHILH